MPSTKRLPLRLFQKKSQNVGQSPGTLTAYGKKRKQPAKVTLIDYDAPHCRKQKIESLRELRPVKDRSTKSWINIDGITDIAVLEEIGELFDIHPLVLEDIVNSGQRIKIEEFDDYLFVVLKMITYSEESESFHQENVSLILGKQFLISFHETPGAVFEVIEERMQRHGSRLRAFGCDYLAYSLVDLIVDHYYVVIEKYGGQIEGLELEMSKTPDSELLNEIQAFKRELLLFLGAIFPLGDVLKRMMKEDVELITDETRVFLGDVKDHFKQVIEAITTCGEIAGDMLNGYLSLMSYRTNEVMRVLTIFAVIFIPLTFIAGIYGMNFDFMPELHLKFMYPLLWVLMISVAGSMLIYFKHKKWF